MTDRRIKCRFCNWETLTFMTNHAGKRKNGFSLLQDHVVHDHPVQWLLIQNELGEDEQWELEPE